MRKDYYNIVYKDISLVVEGYYISSEKGYMYDGNLDGLPDSSAEFNIESVFVIDSSIDVSNFFSANDLTEIQDIILEKL